LKSRKRTEKRFCGRMSSKADWSRKPGDAKQNGKHEKKLRRKGISVKGWSGGKGKNKTEE